MALLEPETEALLRACCEVIKPKWEKRFNYIDVGKTLGFDENAASDLADELADKGYFEPLAYGEEASLDRIGREFARRTMSGTPRATTRNVPIAAGTKAFISHSSRDKELACKIAERLHMAGVVPWIDEWESKVGESITAKIEQGLVESQFVILLLSKHSVDSKWVDSEWRAKYWHQIEANKVCVLPVLIGRRKGAQKMG